MSIYNAAKATVEGTFTDDPNVDDLSTGGIYLSYSGGYIDDIKDTLEEYKAKIISGKLYLKYKIKSLKIYIRSRGNSGTNIFKINMNLAINTKNISKSYLGF